MNFKYLNTKEEIIGKSGVYKITNVATGIKYIGSAKNIASRWDRHIRNLKEGTHMNKPLQEAYNTYGSDNFTFEVVEYCEPDIRKEREQVYLDLYYNVWGWDLLYNRNPNAKGGHIKGEPFSDEHKQNLSKAHSKYIYTYDLESNYMFEFDSLQDCSKYLFNNGLVHTKGKHPVTQIQKNISKAITNNRPYQNMIFSYTEL